MTSLPKEDVAPAKAATLSEARTSSSLNKTGMVAPSKDQTACLDRPVANPKGCPNRGNKPIAGSGGQHRKNRPNLRRRQNQQKWSEPSFTVPKQLKVVNFDIDGLTSLINDEGNLPTRDELQYQHTLAKCPIVYTCSCGKRNYGFPNSCGCKLIDQVKCMYSELIGVDLLEKDDDVKEKTEKKPEMAICDLALKDNSTPEMAISKMAPKENGKPKTPMSDEVRSLLSTWEVINQNDLAKQTIRPALNKNKGMETIGELLPKVGAPELIVEYPKFGVVHNPSIFNFTDYVNHHIGKVEKLKDKSQMNQLTVPDELIIPELYAYLRRREHESYKSRPEKLSHMVKLASKWENETLKLEDHKAKPLDINRYFLTIQKVVDARDTVFLLKEVQSQHSRSKPRIMVSRITHWLNR
jgi:hypothetical protein